MPTSEAEQVITIDGPSGVGKTTLGRWLADRQRFGYCESGYVYRAIAYRTLVEKIGEGEWDERLAEGLTVTARQPPPEPGLQEVLLEGRSLDIEEELYSPAVDERVVKVATIEAVRRVVSRVCRPLVERGRLVLSGRDAGSAIAPQASIKLFLTAERSARIARRGGRIAETSHREELESRLLSDRIVPSPDATVIDTTDLSQEEVRSLAWKAIAAER
ncbi:MAG TPA: (d)CMP kinase [Solirubrobacterales bacterium]|nr:(d)CMP kinase [Solirubrobacterales bacterium]